MAYEHQPYPSVRYHRSGATRIVNNELEHNELTADGEWADTPAAFDAEPAADEEPAAEKPKRKR